VRAFLKTCKHRIQDIPGKIFDFLKRWNEAHLLIFLVLMWNPVSRLLIWYDAASAPLDAAVMQKGYLGALFYAGFSLMIWVGMKINAPILFRFWEGIDDNFDNFTKAFNGLTQWQKILILFFYLALQCFLAVECLKAASVSI
jgi:hypothetical protein